MTTDLAPIQQLPHLPDLAERDRNAARAVASGLRDAKAGTTRRVYGSAWASSWLGPGPVATRRCPPPRIPWPSTWAT